MRSKENYTVVIQAIAETDKRIRESSMTGSAASHLPGPALCKMLGVDAVMKGTSRATRSTARKQVGGAVAKKFPRRDSFSWPHVS
jgi:hypothetical protein